MIVINNVTSDVMPYASTYPGFAAVCGLDVTSDSVMTNASTYPRFAAVCSLNVTSGVDVREHLPEVCCRLRA